jgi:hypothetical protein
MINHKGSQRKIKVTQREKPLLNIIYKIVNMKHNIILLIIMLLALSCSDNDLKNSEKIINTSDLAYYVKNLASDEFMGRKPFTS